MQFLPIKSSGFIVIPTMCSGAEHSEMRQRSSEIYANNQHRTT